MKVLLSASILFASVSALEVKLTHDQGYSVSEAGKVLFSAEDGIAAFVEGKWQTPKSGMKYVSTKYVSGSEQGLGAFKGTSITWKAGAETTIVTTAKTYASGRDVGFEYSFPDGAKGTSQVKLNNSTRDEVILNFPTFTTVNLQGKLSWQGSFVGAQENQYSQGPIGGPTVFYDPDDASLGTVIVGSAVDNFKATSAGPNKSWKGSDAWSPGTPATIESLPVGWTQRFMMHLGSTTSKGEGGITVAIGEWGKLLQGVHKSHKTADVTLSKIGYQTDNGAFYVFCRGNCSEILMDKLDELKDLGVPMGYLSFQGAGASSIDTTSTSTIDLQEVHEDPSKIQAAPWCVNTWGVDGALGGQYPVPLPEFQKALGVPLQLYAPYFCPNSDYFNSTSNWTSVKSDTNISGCSFYGFQDVEPVQSREFYDWFFAKGKAVGMSSFEPDFMNQNYNCVPAFIESATNATIWQHGMADAALAAGIQVQWCYAAPTDVLASLTMPAVTNFRVSNDFCYGESWNVGVSSLIVWAAGAAPSKDTLWTSTNGNFAVPGCNWSPDHEEPAVELHVIIALMTTGPVGISDGLNMTNAPLIKRTISQDGTLLKPSKPISAIDSSIAKGDGNGDSNKGGRPSPKGHVYTTYSADVQSGATTAFYFVSFKMKEAYKVTGPDFYPPLDGAALTQTMAVRTANAQPCTSSSSSGSISAVSVSAHDCGISLQQANQLAVAMPKSDFTNTTGGTDFSPAVTTVWPVCTSGYAILGDLSKYVPASSDRFDSLTCTKTGAHAIVTGSPGEKVSVAVLDTNGANNGANGANGANNGANGANGGNGAGSVSVKVVTLNAKGKGSVSVP